MSHANHSYLPAAGLDILLPFYDPLVKLLGADRARRKLFEQAVAATLVAEQHEILAQHPYRLGRPRPIQLVGERHRMPVVAHQRAAPGAGPDAGDQLVLLGSHGKKSGANQGRAEEAA